MMKNNLKTSMALFVAIILMISPKLSFAQGPERYFCSGEVVTDLIIGEGTTITHSSQFPFFNVTNVQIVGNFVVDNNFILENKNVTINNDVSIIVQDEANLTLKNSTLVGCDSLWNGIFLQEQTSIHSFDSRIEDAKTAIYSKSASTINLTNTIFNRNLVGLELSKGILNSPEINTFRKNKFTCTSPINGTNNEITKAGIILNEVSINLNLNSYSTLNNSIFKGIKNGIMANGINSELIANGLEFRDVLANGINMSSNQLILTNSIFENCGINGIFMENVLKLDVSYCQFIIDESNGSLRPRSGIRTNGFLDNAIIIIEDNDQSYILGETTSRSRIFGIRMIGDGSSSNASILISDNSSELYDRNSSACIFLDGEFPTNSSIDLRVNEFKCSAYAFGDPITANYAIGIYSSGERENMNIQANDFRVYGVLSSRLLGIFLEDSAGNNNLISENETTLLKGIFVRLDNFKNSVICSNKTLQPSIGLGGISFDIFGDNSGTQFTQNIMRWVWVGVRINDNAILGPQIHQGNRWISTLVGDMYAAITCTNCDVEQNRFEVHTDQSTIVPGASPSAFIYSYNSPYYPASLFPQEIMIKTDGAPPTSSCVAFIVNEESPVNELSDSSDNHNEKSIVTEVPLVQYEQEVKIYPNPTDHEVTIVVPEAMTREIMITDVSGKEVISVKVEGDSRFNFELDEGIYFVRFRMKGGELMTKLLQVF